MKFLKNLLMLLFLLAAAATAAPNEATGTVIGVVSGDIFVVVIDESDPRIGSENETVKLADVSLSPIESAEGRPQKSSQRAFS